MGRCCGKKNQELSEEDLADLRSIERRVKLDDRPWSGKWCLRFEMIILPAAVPDVAPAAQPEP